MKKIVLLAFVLVLLSTAMSLCIVGLLELHIAHASPYADKFNVEVGNSAAYVSVPFHYQSKIYYCGPAALEMVFDYYGEDVPQTEIADVARTYPLVTYIDELRRAAHFSNLSTSLGDEMLGNVTGYSARKIGYAAFEQGGLTIDYLKALVNKGEPLIVLMWWTPSKVYGHYRVVVGYNETHIITHDPWNKDVWGGTYGGANTSMAYSTFLDLWQYSGKWGLLVHPWNIELYMPSIVSKGDNFEVTANITYPCSTPFDTADYPASSCEATIELQEGLELGLGETTQHSLGNVIAGNSVQTSWLINASEAGFRNISVTVTGIIEGSVWAHETYPSYNYQDKIGGSRTDSLSIINETYRVHNIDTGKNYTTIQSAIDDSDTLDGHIISVDAGTYYEHVTVNKSISLVGEDRDTTIIDGNGTGSVVSVTRSNVTITGFIIRNGSNGINLNFPGVGQCRNITICNNLITDMSGCGILVFSSASNRIVRNTIFNSWVGINLGPSYSNIVSQNTISNNKRKGIASGLILVPIFSRLNSVADDPNKILENLIVDNGCGINITNRGGEIILHNNFVNNTVQAYVLQQYGIKATNIWDNGFEGNYWSDYNGTDFFSGPYRDETGSDGIGDKPYTIDVNNQDNYPLMGMFSDFNATSGYHVQTICNSTISDFQFNGTAICFNVTDENGTTGFCRICIPTGLMNDTYRVFVNGTEVSCTLLPCSNSTHSYLYFSYEHSTQEVVIVPEFPTWISMLLMLIVLTLAITIYKQRLLKKPIR